MSADIHIIRYRLPASPIENGGDQKDAQRPINVDQKGGMAMQYSEVGCVARTPADKRHLTAQIEHSSSLDQVAVDEMFDLYSVYYEATSRELFASDLANKDFVILLREAEGAIAGFSTLALLDIEYGPTFPRAIYSGDTIIDRAHWGTQALAFAWIRFAGTVKAKAPERPLYWFLIVKGHRTYRYLSAFSREFYPHWQAPTPAWAKSIMDGLAQRRFAEAYDARRGIVAFPQSRGHLRAHWASVDPAESARPDVSFFLQRNAGYHRGDEMVCLTELCSENLRPLARRVFDQGFLG